MSWFKFTVCLTVIFLISIQIKIGVGQNVFLPRQEIEDPFKDNPKWEDFKSLQIGRLDQLQTLVNNVWNLVDSISALGPKLSFKEAFIRFHFRAFQDFFLESHDKLRDGNPFSIINPIIGLRHISKLLKSSNYPPNHELNKFRSKWANVDAVAAVIHQAFNKTTEMILTAGKNDTAERSVKIGKEAYEVTMPSDGGDGSGNETKTMTLEEMAAKIDEEVTSLGTGAHLMRGLLQILRDTKQSDLDISQYVNYFCYGNNEFGIIPELLDFLTDAAHYLVLVDLKKLILDVYFVALPLFSNDLEAKVKDTLPQRNALWEKMVGRVHKKLNFDYLNGTGWGTAASPAVFKCDIPPEIAGYPGQWGRNVTTGVSPNSTKIYSHDPQTGPQQPDGEVGYLDDRSPLIQAATFENAFQGYIESELVLSHPSPSCVGTCADYTHLTGTCEGDTTRCAHLRSYHCDENKDCMKTSVCPLKARKCIRASRNVTMCPSSDPSKLYDWINLDGKILKRTSVSVNESECQSGPTVSAVERWEMTNDIILNAPEYCELCLCTCMTANNAGDQMYFDIQEIITDISAGKLISAVRFVKEGNVVRLAIEEGKPLKKGFIDETTLKWVEPKPSDKQNANKTVPIGLGIVGFMKLNLDLIIGETGTVLTGIRFRRENESLSLEIQTTPITWPDTDSKQITLKSEESKWLSTIPYPTSRQAIRYERPGDPMAQSGPSMPDSMLNTFVEFTTTSYEEDLAQTVIPFFDTQPVYYYEGRRWLRGLGILHKGKPGSGGFIAPMIVPAKPYTAIRYFPIPPEVHD